MSVSKQRIPMIKELTTGVHLVTISKAFIGTDTNNNTVTICFSDGFNKLFEHDYYLVADKIFALKKLCAVTGIDIRVNGFNKAILGKRLWIAIKEVHKEENVDYFIFDTLICNDQCIRPIISGDPIQNPKGVPMGVFIEHKRTELFSPGVKGVIDESKAQKIADAREMIKKVEGKEMTSLNQPNKTVTQNTDWEDF